MAGAAQTHLVGSRRVKRIDLRLVFDITRTVLFAIQNVLPVAAQPVMGVILASLAVHHKCIFMNGRPTEASDAMGRLLEASVFRPTLLRAIVRSHIRYHATGALFFEVAPNRTSKLHDGGYRDARTAVARNP